ncbi:orotidine-5'-phosphate decarboxylase [Shimazuella sp. AN120528]|uniref:orotidine-5'-phosphate decarboxylase n=1 Tax=Shimazuella soli TaxID=1892854 RepID=UPI001F1086CB|nr:orotidine-5'-phosphate decarboxylase [Shimazuella soli]MCH5586327.1 orotidine-5'-phosphate decarboxylase [Shimazuella soli]
MFLNTPNSHIILAIDTPDRTSTLHVLDQCYDVVDAIKFNYPLILKEGLSLLTEVKRKYNLPIIADFKVADVPVTNNRIANLVKDAGADAIMVHGFIGSDSILELKEVAGNEMGIIIVTELTSPGGLEFTRQHATQFAELCNFLDCYGIQAPGTRPDQIKALRGIVGSEKVIVSCGIGAQGGQLADAIDAGATFGIIGRAIYEDKHPRAAAIRFQKEVSKHVH